MSWRRRRAEAEAGDAAPTMIIPQGAQIEVDSQGQLSVQAPGNLVIQNSGRYGTLESLAGSIRIDRAVEVEAVTVRCADTCYVQGSLTAWRVVARCLHLEDTARAHVVLQETARLEVGRDARMVGNFASEGELLGLFSRFAQQVRSLPFALERGQPAALAAAAVAGPPAAIVEVAAPAAAEPSAPPLAELPESLLFALVLLEREAEMRIHGPIAQRAIQELSKLLEEQDLETLRATYRTLFGRVVEPREDVRRARELIGAYFDGGG